MVDPKTIPATEPRCPVCDWPGYEDLRREVKRLTEQRDAYFRRLLDAGLVSLAEMND